MDPVEVLTSAGHLGGTLLRGGQPGDARAGSVPCDVCQLGHARLVDLERAEVRVGGRTGLGAPACEAREGQQTSQQKGAR